MAKPMHKPKHTQKHKPNCNTNRNQFLPLLALLTSPLSLTLTIISLFGSSENYNGLAKPFWFPSVSVVHAGSTGSTVLMSLSAWLVWASGGLHLQSNASPLYLAHIASSIVWYPLVLRLGAIKVGFVYCLINFGTVFGCYLSFAKVNPCSKVFVKPCLVWAAYLTLVTWKLKYI